MNHQAGQLRDKPMTVSQLTSMIKSHLEPEFPQLWMMGEISNFSRASSGHLYFSLKDKGAQIRATMWRSQAQALSINPKDGLEVIVQGGVNVYAPRGEYSLMVTKMEEVGLGRLRQAFDELKLKLHKEGLFDVDRKKTLPMMPKRVGVVTSPTGAAFRDIVRVMRKRYAGVHILLYPVRVQGESAAGEIANAIAILDQQYSCDVLIVGRGGGSEEDLWAFNEEVVARAIAACQTPIISAVGHEVDITIADFTADVRAATPSHAAELVVKSLTEYSQMIRIQVKNLDQLMARSLTRLRMKIHRLETHPSFERLRSKINDSQRRLLDLEFRLDKGLKTWLSERVRRLEQASHGLRPDRLKHLGIQLGDRLLNSGVNLERNIERIQAGYQQRVSIANSRLHDLSPQRILDRGYAVVYDHKGELVKARTEVKPGEVIRVQLAHDHLHARVVEQDRAEQTNLFEGEG